MQKNYRNKAMDSEEVENKNLEEQEFHFSGGTEFEPMAIKAKSLKEAEEIFEEKKVKIIR